MSLRDIFQRNRRRISLVVAVTGITLIASLLAGAAPRHVTLRLDLGPAHEAASGLELTLTQDGELVRSARFGFGEGAPRLVRHEFWLAPGRYALNAIVRGGGHAREHRRHIEVSSGMSEELRVEVFDVAFARLVPWNPERPPLQPLQRWMGRLR